MSAPPQTMNFFASQDVSRRRTWELSLLFLFAAALEVAGIAFVAGAVFAIAARIALKDLPATLTGFLVYGSPIGLSILVAGFVVELVRLRRGGMAIVNRMNALPLPDPPTSLPDKMLRNIVEEMAIAARIAPPAIYVMREETAINAFAAGDAGKDAVLGVTQAAIEKLTREELQGVVAHEFSHILNRDTRLNRRILSVIFSLSCVFLLGYNLMLLLAPGPKYKAGFRAPQAGIPIFIAGITLIGVGLFGEFLGRLVSAAVTRQRESLADASAVQFTRNPRAIASALFKIAQGNPALHSRHAMEMSHFLFAEGSNSAWHKLGFLDSHPPLRARIRAVDPTFLAKQFAWKDTVHDDE